MQRVSNEYKAGMKKLLRERSYMMVSFGLVNQEAMANATIEGNNFTYFSNKEGLFGKVPDYNTYGTFEHDFTKVDGSMYFLPREGGVYFDSGLIGNDVVNEGEPYYELDIELNVLATDVKGLTLNFGEVYPVDFDILTSSGQTIRVRDNKQSDFVIEDVLVNTTFVKFRFYKMKNPDSRVRVYAIQLGFGLVYYNNDIMDSSLSSYVSPICEDVPQIDFSVKLQNYNQYFNVDNPNSAINFLETGQEMYVWYGHYIEEKDSIEWFQAAKLLCSEWESDDFTATIKCQDLFRSMQDEYYKGQYYPGGITLYDLAVLIFEDAAIENYYIDPYLKKLSTKNPMPRVRHKEALQIIANAGRCILTQNSKGVPEIRSSFKPEYEFETNGEAPYSNVHNIKSAEPKDEYASFATNYTTVDEEMSFLTKDHKGGLYTGYISAQQSDENGLFEENPIIRITQETQCKYYGFKILFGSALPAEFTVRTFNNGQPIDELTYDESMISKYTAFLMQEFSNFDVMEIEFTKTAEPFNRIVVDHFEFGDITDFTMERQDMTSSPKSIKQELVKRVDVACFTYTKGAANLETVISEEIEVKAGDVILYYLGNASYGYEAKFNDLQSNVEIVSTGAYYITVEFKVSGKATFEVNAYKFQIVEQYSKNELHNRGKVITWQNPLVGDIGMADDLAEWLGDYYDAGIEYEYNSRGNPEIEANDVIYQENAYVEDMKVRVYRHTTNFNGSLSGKVVARRVAHNSA